MYLCMYVCIAYTKCHWFLLFWFFCSAYCEAVFSGSLLLPTEFAYSLNQSILHHPSQCPALKPLCYAISGRYVSWLLYSQSRQCEVLSWLVLINWFCLFLYVHMYAVTAKLSTAPTLAPTGPTAGPTNSSSNVLCAQTMWVGVCTVC